METIFAFITAIAVFVGTIIATTLSLPLEPTIVFTGYAIGVVTLIIFPVLFIMWVRSVSDVRPSRLLRDIHAYERQAHRARKMIKDDIQRVTRMFEDALTARDGVAHHYSYFVIQMNGREVELVFHRAYQATDTRIIVPITIFDRSERAQLEYIRDMVMPPIGEDLREVAA